MEIEDDSGVQDLQPRTALSSRSGKSTLVGLHKELKEILDWLGGNSLARDTLTICGMAGIGKTTFARKIYDEVQIYFDVRAWATVSQNYDERKILLDLLDSMNHPSGQKRPAHNLETSDLKEILYKKLKGRRYLIVIDDIWHTEVWDDVNRLFPVDKERSRIILTTRLESVAFHVTSSPGSDLHRMRFLNDDESRKLFCEKVFGEGCCPGELEQTGTEIVKKCGGLPLAIVLIGGLLSKSARTQRWWDYVAKNFSSVITSHDDQWSTILHLSYNNLPHHLRVCFIYMGVFPEDYEILASKLVKLWIAEGFIEPVTSKSLEDVAQEYLLNLVERSLILLSKRSSEGKIKTCKIHDLLRKFCVREAKKKSFFHVIYRNLRGLPGGISTSHVTDTNLQRQFISLRRVSIHPNTETSSGRAYNLPASTVRSVLNFDPTLSPSVEFLNSSLLRVLDTVNGNSSDFPTETIKLLNLRYLACLNGVRELPSPIYELRNLQTLILSCTESPFRLPLEIWRMPQLRHVHLNSVILPDPPIAGVEGENSLIVLQDLQSLSTVMNFKFVEDILRRIANLKKLGILYVDVWEDYYLNNLALLQNLEALKCLFHFPCKTFFQKISFPHSLKKLTLRGCLLPWKDMGIVGSLPELQVLKLKRKAFNGPVWKPNEEEFCKLKFLLLEENNLEDWEAERSHFPKLEHLILDNCQSLKNVPSDFAQIPTLQKIEFYYCNDSLVTSSKDIEDQQHDSGNENFQIRIVKMTAEEYETC